MIVSDIMNKLNLKLVGGENGLLRNIHGVYVCDLLSWVMSHAKGGDVWITIQTHPNVIAVASLIELSCVIIPENAEIDAETIKKANSEDIPLLTSSQNSYELSCLLYNLSEDIHPTSLA